MATSAKLTLKGLEEYLEKIAAAGKDVDEAVAKAVLAGAEVLQEGMQMRAPERTGNLKNNIRIYGPEQDGFNPRSPWGERRNMIFACNRMPC